MSPMKVLILAPSFGAFGGIEAFSCALAREFFRHSDVETTLCFKLTKNCVKEEHLERIARETGARVVFVDRASIGLAKVIRNADVVHCQYPSIDVALLCLLFRKPLALTTHNYYEPGVEFRKMLRDLSFRIADRHWYNSDFVWKTWEPYGRLPHSEKLPVISNLPTGILPISERKGFAFVARWIANKGIEVLVEAYTKADIDHEKWPLVLMGSGPLRERIEKKIRDENLRGIEIKGLVDETTRNHYIRHARWMVAPSNTKEGLGLTPIEGRNVGVPCIITRDGALPEAGGRHALICEPENMAELKALLEKAAGMKDDEYVKLCEATHKELLEYLQPLSTYLLRYRDMLSPHKKALFSENR